MVYLEEYKNLPPPTAPPSLVLPCLNHWFLKFPFSCLPSLPDEMPTTTWGSPEVFSAASGRKLAMSWGSFQFHISVISTIILPTPSFVLFGHRLHDPKFSKALMYMSHFILYRKVVRNELELPWNDFPGISVKPFSQFPPLFLFLQNISHSRISLHVRPSSQSCSRSLSSSSFSWDILSSSSTLQDYLFLPWTAPPMFSLSRSCCSHTSDLLSKDYWEFMQLQLCSLYQAALPAVSLLYCS